MDLRSKELQRILPLSAVDPAVEYAEQVKKIVSSLGGNLLKTISIEQESIVFSLYFFGDVSFKHKRSHCTEGCVHTAQSLFLRQTTTHNDANDGEQR